MKYMVRTPAQLEELIADLRKQRLPVRVEVHSGTRTLTQNAALHVYLAQVAEVLNTAGFDMKRTLRHDADIPWAMESVKEYLWRPVQEAMTGQESTADASKTDYADVQDALARHLAQRVGVTLPPWPSRDAA